MTINKFFLFKLTDILNIQLLITILMISETHFLYFVMEGNVDIFQKFIISDEDHLIRSSTIEDITRVLSESM